MEKILKSWHFSFDNDNLVSLALEGKQKIAIFLYNENITFKQDDEAILIFDNEKKACITKFDKIIVTEFKNITKELAILDVSKNLEEFKINYTNHFRLLDKNFNENTLVEIRTFTVTKNLIQERLELAKKIANSNIDILGKVQKIEEINAGFNNSIFCINDTFIIKVCGNINDEKLFDTESHFYKSNADNENIPKLYEYDNTKKIVPFVYEIIEKINGKSVYYHWYKMNEKQREKLIENIVIALQKIHKEKYQGYNWCSYVKDDFLTNFNVASDIFNNEEKNMILNSLNLYDKFLLDNTFCLIHNDLHFDNILIDENGKVKIIDFNDAMIAPFDYDFRILYMSVTQPWKWANSEMDPFQKPKDYANLFKYVLKYYPELNNVKYLNQRMIIYTILNDIKLLPRFKNNELKNHILDNTKKLLALK